jgi:hydrogenase maturation protease
MLVNDQQPAAHWLLVVEADGMRQLVLGLGNDILGDDAVGLRVARQVAGRLAGRADVTVAEDERGGLALIEQLAGFDRVLLIDAIQTGAPAGTLHDLRVDSVPTQRTATAHGINLRMALELGRRSGVALPADEAIAILGIEAGDVLTFAEGLSPDVEQAIPLAMETVWAWLKKEDG